LVRAPGCGSGGR